MQLHGRRGNIHMPMTMSSSDRGGYRGRGDRRHSGPSSYSSSATTSYHHHHQSASGANHFGSYSARAGSSVSGYHGRGGKPMSGPLAHHWSADRGRGGWYSQRGTRGGVYQGRRTPARGGSGAGSNGDFSTAHKYHSSVSAATLLSNCRSKRSVKSFSSHKAHMVALRFCLLSSEPVYTASQTSDNRWATSALHAVPVYIPPCR